ncbi:MAG TPA: hypothetical protein VF838_14535 [Trebonia sp.]
MTRLAIFRPAGRDVSVPAVTTPEGGIMPRRERPWRRRLHALGAHGQSVLEIQHAVLERLLALLEAARADLSAGWAQDGWWAIPADGGQQILVTGLAAGGSAPHNADAVCLVGALIRAGAAQGGDAEVGRAIDAVYDALWETRGQPAAATGLITVSSPQVRLARAQALTRWNDAQGRTSGEILATLDRAIARVIQTLAALPAPHPVTG